MKRYLLSLLACCIFFAIPAFSQKFNNQPMPMVGISSVTGTGPYEVTFTLTFWNDESSPYENQNLTQDSNDTFDSTIWDSLTVYNGAALIYTFPYNSTTKLGATSWTTSIAAGSYRYEFRAHDEQGGETHSTFIEFTLDGGLVSYNRGKVIVVVDSGIEAFCPEDVTQFILDLEGEGYDVSKMVWNKSVQGNHIPLKTAILALTGTTSPFNNYTGVILIGEVPQPLSGWSSYDGHGGREVASDTWYITWDETYSASSAASWTDYTVNQTTNVPGDGIFDQSSCSGMTLDAWIGRIDPTTCALLRVHGNEAAINTNNGLVQYYLKKNHKYKTKQYSPERGATYQNQFSFVDWETNSAANTGIQSYLPGIVGGNEVEETMQWAWHDYIGSPDRGGYLISGGSGPGGGSSVDGYMRSDHMTLNDLPSYAIYHIFFGSYLHEYESTNHLQPQVIFFDSYNIACIYSAWGYNSCRFNLNGLKADGAFNGTGTYTTTPAGHLGYTFKYTADNAMSSFTNVSNIVTGDPTARAWIVEPPVGAAARGTGTVVLSWNPPASGIPTVGYEIRRANSLNAPVANWTLLTTTNNQTYTWTDTTGTGTQYYRIHAISHGQSGSGLFRVRSLPARCVSGTAVAIHAERLDDCFSGESYRFQVTSSGANATTWTATGLPSGLGIDNTGLITGTTSAAAGDFNVSLTANGSVTKTVLLRVVDTRVKFVELTPTADCRITGDGGAFNGDELQLVYSSNRRILMKFDLTSIPVSAMVEYADIQLYLINRAGDSPCDIYPVTSSWTETAASSVTWNTGISDSLKYVDIESVTDTFYYNGKSTPDYFTLPATNVLSSIIDGTIPVNNGLAIVPLSGTMDNRQVSKDYKNPDYHPKLLVRYRLPYTYDSDSDGLPDEWEVQYGLNPDASGDQTGDPDSDGYTNLDEYDNGTNPFIQDALTFMITTASLPDGQETQVYTPVVINAAYGSEPYVWSAATGLPAGMTFSTATHTLSGTPTASGSFTVGLTVTDSGSAVATRNLSLFISAGETTATLSALQDTYTNGTSGNESNAYGTATELYMFSMTNNVDYTKAALYQFDLTGITASSVVSATLRVHCTNEQTNKGGECRIFGMNDAWVEATATYLTTDGATLWGSGSGANVTASFDATPTDAQENICPNDAANSYPNPNYVAGNWPNSDWMGGFVEFDVTALVEDWLGLGLPRDNNGLAVVTTGRIAKPATADPDFDNLYGYVETRWASKENATASRHPELVIVYLPGGATTYSISGTVSGAVQSGVTITLGGDATAITTTDGSGNYSFSGLADGTYTLTPSLSGYTFSPTSLTGVVVSGANVPAQNFTATASAATNIVVTGSPVAVTEQNTVGSTFTVALNGSGTGNATLTASANFRMSLTNSEASAVSPLTVPMTGTTAITVYVFADDDVDTSNEAETCTITYASLPNATVNVTITDNDTPTHTITASASANGSISPSVSVSVADGANQTFTITPNAGYHIATVLVDSINNPTAVSTGTYTFSNVTMPHTIAASFDINTYSITVTQGANGTITPGTTSVNHGADQTFTITPDAGYQISDVRVDGLSVGIVSNYPFTNVTAAHTITADFSPVLYAVDGSITVTGDTTSVNGGTLRLMDGGTEVGSCIISGGTYSLNVPAGTYTYALTISGYTLTVTTPLSGSITVSGAQTLAIEVNAVTTTTWTITSTAGANGSVSPSGAVIVANGSNQTFTITANSGYQIADVLVDGSSVGIVASYSFTNVTAAHTISATFQLISATMIVVTGSPVTVTEQNTAGSTFTVALNGPGTGNATLTASANVRLSLTDNAVAAVSPLTVPMSGTTAITVYVFADDDVDLDDEIETCAVSYSGLADASVIINITDNDTTTVKKKKTSSCAANGGRTNPSAWLLMIAVAALGFRRSRRARVSA
ncbi:MAG: DNRLRE domain-containing protein [Planctomycetota bacterium]